MSELPETLVETEFSKQGVVFEVIESTESRIALLSARGVVAFSCICPAFPDIKALGCSLHSPAGSGSSWEVQRALEDLAGS